MNGRNNITKICYQCIRSAKQFRSHESAQHIMMGLTQPAGASLKSIYAVAISSHSPTVYSSSNDGASASADVGLRCQHVSTLTGIGNAGRASAELNDVKQLLPFHLIHFQCR